MVPIGSPNCTLSTFPGWGWGVVGKCVSKENPKSDLDLGLRVCQQNIEIDGCYYNISRCQIKTNQWTVSLGPEKAQNDSKDAKL